MAEIKNAIVASIDTSIQNKNAYRGNVQYISIFVDASEKLVNSGDVLVLTAPLPANCRAVELALNHAGTNGVGASTTLAITAGGTILTPTATIPTSADTDSTLITYSLKNSDVSGLTIIGTVGGADWSDTVDMHGHIKIVTDE